MIFESAAIVKTTLVYLCHIKINIFVLHSGQLAVTVSFKANINTCTAINYGLS